MSETSHPSSKRNGFLARHRRLLLAGVFGLAALGAVSGGSFDFRAATPALAADGALMNQPANFADVVEKVQPAVVSVKVKIDGDVAAADGEEAAPQGMPDLPKDHPLRKWFKEFGFGDAPEGGKPQHGPRGLAQGSGFFISADGYAVTNNHVVANGGDVEIVTSDGKSHPAKVIGTDPKTDLALLKVKDGDSFPFVKLGEKTPRVGEWVIAVGNPFGLGGTVTAGIVSARGRDIGAGPYDDFIQIDAAVNKGNSGGPAFNLNGEVIGVNTAIFSPTGGSVGIGFAIPADTVEKVVAQLKEDGKVTRGWIGVQIQPVTPDIAESVGLEKASGALVADVTSGGPAEEAGIKSGDTILTVNGKTVEGPRELAKMVAELKPGKAAEVTLWRDGKEKTLSVDLAAFPKEERQAKAEDSQPKAEPTSMAALGLKLAPASKVAGDDAKGVAVIDVDPDSPAAEQMRQGDIILDVAGRPVNRVADVREAIEKVKADGRRSVLMRVLNGKDSRFVALPIGKA